MASRYGIVGPTATGKTALAVALAHHLGAAELLNADSRQVIRGLRVGTSAPTVEELAGVRCHLLDLHEPGERFTVAAWVRRARAALDEIEGRGATAILVGGTGLYVDALTRGFELTGEGIDLERRRRRTERAATAAGVAELASELGRRDPRGAATVDLRNPRRVIRALEILDSGAPSIAARGRPGGRPAALVGIDVEPGLHRRLIRERAGSMVRGGALIAEVEAALARGVSAEALAASGIGYTEALRLREGHLTLEEAVEAIAVRTLRYARAQRTWFRARPEIRWIRREEPAETGELLGAALAALGSGAR